MPQVAKKIGAVQRAYEWVRERILDGTFAGGQLISEGEVADALNLSRTPVREAFLRLASEDMLQLYPKRGALVIAIDVGDLRDVLTARALIEPWAASLVAGNGDRETLARELRKLTEAAQAALSAHDDKAFQEADRAFHQRLVDAAQNRLLTNFYSSLRDRQLRAGALARHAHPDRAPSIVSEHLAILNAVENGDPQAASEAVRAHLRGTALALGLAPVD